MFWSYTLEINGNNPLGVDEFVTHTFQIIPETVRGNGWAKARLIQIKREKDGEEPQIGNYDPAIHDDIDGHYMSRPYTTRLVSKADTKKILKNKIHLVKVYWETGEVRVAVRDEAFVNPGVMPPAPPAPPAPEPEEEQGIDPYDDCPKCGFRIGSHSIMESVRCGLITKEDARDAFSRQRPAN